MKITKLETKEQTMSPFLSDIVLVHWKSNSEPVKRGRPITLNAIWGIHKENEVIVDYRKNWYFNIDFYLKGESTAAEAYLVTL